jgi:hypothetical protein
MHFAGTGEAYARYRPPYPPEMLDAMLSEAGVRGGTLLDLATGPGRIALDLATRFERVIAVDLVGLHARTNACLRPLDPQNVQRDAPCGSSVATPYARSAMSS